jgi:hypothetical protein
MRRPGTQAVPLHKNWLLWFVGAMRAAPYREYLAEHPGPRGTEQSLKAALLEPPDEQRERRDIAYAKLDFYGLVETGGRGMIVLGGLLAAGGWARRLRPDSPARPRPADGVPA